MFQKELYNFESLCIFIQKIYTAFWTPKYGKHTEFHLKQLRFSVTPTGNAGCFKKSFTI
jgi:hypothetical protein